MVETVTDSGGPLVQTPLLLTWFYTSMLEAFTERLVTFLHPFQSKERNWQLQGAVWFNQYVYQLSCGMTHTQKHLLFSICYKPKATHAALEISNLTIFSPLSDLCSCLLKTPDTTHLYTLFLFFLNYVLLLNLKISPTSTGLNLKSLLRIYVIMN